MLYGMAKNIAAKNPPIGFGISLEPFTSFFPEQGPDAYLLYRKFRQIFDPGGISSPGRQVYSEEEYDRIKELMGPQLESMKKLVRMNPVAAKILMKVGGIVGKIKKNFTKESQPN